MKPADSLPEDPYEGQIVVKKFAWAERTKGVWYIIHIFNVTRTSPVQPPQWGYRC